MSAFVRVLIHGAADPGATWWTRLRAELPAAIEWRVAGTGALCAAARAQAIDAVECGPDATDALRAATGAFGVADTLAIAAGASLPPWCAHRLQRGADSGAAQVVSALDNARDELSPLAEGTRAELGDPLSWDAAVYLFGERRVLPSELWSPLFALWRAPALEWLRAHPDWDGGVLPAALSGALCADLFVADPQRELRGPPSPADPRERAAASPLSALRDRLRPVPPDLALYPGLDPRPVVLHVLHGWGGGAERFVRDLASADRERSHLALIARGHTSRRAYGEALELALAADPSYVLQRWPLPRPIAATALEDGAYRTVLEQVQRDYGVDSVLVSSLIGHALDALATGLPTWVVTHDYYPLWPQLHCDFGDRARRFDRAELQASLRSKDATPFRERDPDWWTALREAYVAALAHAGATLVAPTATVRDNLLRIEPRIAARNIEVIAHGLAPFGAAAVTPPAPSPRERLRVLVLGRIAGGKGERLLHQVVPRLAGRVEFFLLGCGKEGEAFFGCGHVHIELDYERAQLPQLIGAIAPDAALLAASVAETFSYTLSELQALGVPPIATRIGSLGERIEHGRDGILVEPDADALVAALAALAADRAPLQALRAALAQHRPRSLAQMAADYSRLLEPSVRSPTQPVPCAIAAADLQLADATDRATRFTRLARAQARQLLEQQAELERRADWAYQLDRRLDERTRWALSLQQEMKTLVQAERDAHSQTIAAHTYTQTLLSQLQAEFDERTQWALALDARVNELEAERARVFASASWRSTAPLRAAARRFAAFRTALGYRLRRLAAFAHRGRVSLVQRGFVGSLKHLRDRAGARPAALPLPSVPEIDPAYAGFMVPSAAQPRVSIVIPVYNQFRHTYTCLRALADQAQGQSFETIVVDDCSADETAQYLPQIEGVRVLRNAENLGFIGACNAGAALARGEYLVFLNNDTAVQAGWLQALVGTFAQRADCGLVGAKLIYPDGRLQEAGGIVFSDASGWNYGRFADPADCAYEYLREADYCSGAAIMLRRALFEQFSGFDVRYKPAYYEDTDLAFRVREAGLKVYYQPAARVVHFEGVTSGTDTGSGIKRYQLVNQEKFAERWKDVLPRQPRPGTPILLAREHRVRGRILIVDATTPQPDHDSGSLRLVNVMRALIDLGWKVSFFAENQARVERYTADLQQLGVEALYHPWMPDPVAFFRERGAEFDAVWISRHYVAQALIPLVRQFAPRAKVIFDTVDLHYLREQRAASMSPESGLESLAAKTKAQELRVVRAADVTLVVSPVERELLGLECPAARVDVLSNVHQVAATAAGFEQRKDLFFVGGFQHPPNVGAVRWFVQEVWPLLAARLPELRFHIVGSKMPEEIARLMSERVIAHGFVEDLAPFLDGCRVSVAPLRYGAGVKGKVNQAMAHGQPVVATSVAVEGMHLKTGAEVLVADDPESFAREVERAYTDPVLWQQLSVAGQANVRTHFSFEAATTALRKIL